MTNSTVQYNTKQTTNEKHRIEKTNQLKESMQNENCYLLSNYVNCKSPVYYLFDGYEYKTTPEKWHRGHRAHNVKCIRYTQNHIAKIFADEGCELLSQYKNQKTKLKYRFHDREYEITFNEWRYFFKRPHERIVNINSTTE